MQFIGVFSYCAISTLNKLELEKQVQRAEDDAWPVAAWPMPMIQSLAASRAIQLGLVLGRLNLYMVSDVEDANPAKPATFSHLHPPQSLQRLYCL
jgi:hypothetical protein